MSWIAVARDSLNKTKKLNSRSLLFIITLFFVNCYYIIFFLILSYFSKNFTNFLTLFLIWANAVFVFSLTRIFHQKYLKYGLLTPHSYEQSAVVSPKNLERASSKYRWMVFVIDIIFVLLVMTSTTGNGILYIVLLSIIGYDILWITYFTKKYINPLVKISTQFRENHNSQILIFLAGVPGSEYQLNQWVDCLIEVNKKFGVTVLILQDQFIRYGMNLPLPCIKITDTTAATNFVVNGKIKLIIYVNNSQSNHFLLCLRKFIHIHINHGDSDKAENALKTSKDYDYVLMAGRASEDRYRRAGWSKDKMIKIGRPQLGYLKQRNVKNQNKVINILYAPTHEGIRRIDGYSSLATMGVKIVKSILNDGRFRLIVKAHPFSGVFRPQYKNDLLEINRLIMENPINESVLIDNKNPEKKLYDLFLESDILISDISSVAIDYLVLNRPIIATNHFGIDHKKYFDIIPFWKCSYMLYPEYNLIELLEEILENDNLINERKKISEYYLGDNIFQNGRLEEQFIVEIERLMKTTKDSPKKNLHIPWEKFL